MSRIFLSHSSKDNAAAVAIAGWLKEEGWDDAFLDLDPVQGIHPGERWERALYTQAAECAAVLFLVSQNWLASEWCRREFDLAHKLNKRCFVILIEDLRIDDLPLFLKETHQTVSLAAGADHRLFRPKLPVTHEEGYVTFSAEGLARLKIGLEHAGLDPRFFAWPPASDPDRIPYRGLEPMDGLDAGVFFGRDGPIIEALDELRGLRDAAAPRLFVILGASGAGKSSFLRAGLLPRLARDERNFLVLPTLRPERAAISGPIGLIAIVADAIMHRGLAITRAQVRQAVAEGATALRPILKSLLGDRPAQEKPPTIVLTIDQAEELFRAEGREEAEKLLDLVAGLSATDDPAFLVIFAIRSDSYDALERAKSLEGLKQRTFPLLPMPHGAYQTVIEGPLKRLRQAGRKFEIDPGLTEALLEDIERGGGSDALPLLSFTLELLYRDHEAARHISREDYLAFGGLKGAIHAALDRAFAAADRDPRIPRDHEARVMLLRRGFIPWLAGVDPETKSLRRRVARAAQIPEEARPLLDLLVEQRLLTRDVDKDTGEATVEPAHEALLRQWGGLKGWLEEDFGRLATLEGVKRAAMDWDANARDEAWLAHSGARLSEADQLDLRPDLAGLLNGSDRAYLAECRRKEQESRAAQEEKRRTEEALAQEKHESLRQRARASKIISAVTFGGMILSIGFGIWAWRERNDAEKNRKLAESNLTAAVESADALIRDVVDKIKNISGVPAKNVMATLDIAHALQEKLTGNGFASPDLKRSHALSREETVPICLSFGNIDCAEDSAKEAIELRSPLLASRPDDPNLKMELAGAYTKMGDVLKASGDLSQALKFYSDGLALKKEAEPAQGDKRAWLSAMALSLESVGDILLIQNRLDDAFDAYRGAQRDREAVVNADRENAQSRSDLARNSQKIGAALFLQNDRISARKAYDEARALSAALSDDAPKNSEYKEQLAESLEKLGDVSIATNRIDDAERFYKESFEIRSGLVDSDFAKAKWRRDLAQNYNKMGDVHLARGRFDDAASAYSAGLSLNRALVASDDSNGSWLMDLSRSYSKVGDVRLAMGDPSGAMAAYRESLDILKGHRALDPQDVRWKLDVARLNEFIGTILYNRADVAGATQAFKGMLDALDDVAKIAPDRLDIGLKRVETRKKLALADRERLVLHVEAARALLDDLSTKTQERDFNRRRQIDYARTQLGNGRIDLFNLVGEHARLARK